MRFDRRLTVVSIWIVLAGAEASQSEPRSKNSISVAVAAEAVDFKPGSTIPVKLTMTNTTGRDLRFEVMVVQCKHLNYEPVTTRLISVQVDDGKGNPVALTSYGKVVQASTNADKENLGAQPARFGGCAGKSLPVVLKPGESLTEEADLNKEFELKKSGKYTVRAQRLDQESKAVVKSEAVTVKFVAKE